MQDIKGSFSYEPWPAISYEEYSSTLHLLHMGSQAIGKLKLIEPFEPHWAGVALWLTTRGFTTGPLAYRFGFFSVEMDFINHQVICMTSWGQVGTFKLTDMSVAAFVKVLFKTLRSMDIELSINPMPMEVPNPVPFNEDTEVRSYEPDFAERWWHIMLSTQRVMQRYHARFMGNTPPIGLMWGTLDLRDVRYKGTPLPSSHLDYIRRNAMDDAQVEIGWWCGNPAYPRPAFFSFTYPQPAGIEQAKIAPAVAGWNTTLSEFILDYNAFRKSDDPDNDLLAFFESTYQVGAKQAGWNPGLVSEGKPI